MRWILFCLSLFAMASCGKQSNGSYEVAIDPSWYPLSLEGKEAQVTAFSNDLLKEIASLKHIQITEVRKSWDNILQGLEQKKYEAILSAMEPYVFYEKKFSFSNPYLLTGPVLVVPANSTVTTLEEMQGKEIAILARSPDISLVEKNEALLLRPYDSIPQALNDVVAGVMDGAIVRLLMAESYTKDLYKGQLKIAGPPLNQAGIRLITLYQNNEKLLLFFNEGLKELKKNGKYEELLKKWNLDGPQQRS